MEFENDSPVTDDQRSLAQAKHITVQPMNPFLKPEDNKIDVPSDQMIANVDRDTETTAQLAKQTSRPTNNSPEPIAAFKHHVIAIISISLSALAGILIGVYFYLA